MKACKIKTNTFFSFCLRLGMGNRSKNRLCYRRTLRYMAQPDPPPPEPKPTMFLSETVAVHQHRPLDHLATLVLCLSVKAVTCSMLQHTLVDHILIQALFSFYDRCRFLAQSPLSAENYLKRALHFQLGKLTTFELLYFYKLL